MSVFLMRASCTARVLHRSHMMAQRIRSCHREAWCVWLDIGNDDTEKHWLSCARLRLEMLVELRLLRRCTRRGVH